MISITFLVACFNFLLALIMLFQNWKLNRNVIYFSFFLMIISFFSVLYDTIINGGSAHLLMLLIGNAGPLVFISGPLFYFFIRGLVEEKNTFSDKDLIHLVPFFLNMVLLIPYFFKPVEYKLTLAQNSLQNLPYYLNIVLVYFPVWFINAFGILSLAFYVVWSMLILNRAYRKRITKLSGAIRKQYVINFLWLNSIAVASLCLVFMHAGLTLYLRYDPDFYNQIDNNALFIALAILNSFFPLLILFNPGILFGLPTNDVLNPIIQSKNSIEGESRYIVLEAADKAKTYTDYFEGLSKEITFYVENERPYLNHDFLIQDLIRRFEIPHHHVQFCLKYYLGMSFKELSNQYRVKYAIELIQASSGKKQEDMLMDVAYTSGFDKLVDFKKAFKEVEKKKLSQWMAENT